MRMEWKKRSDVPVIKPPIGFDLKDHEFSPKWLPEGFKDRMTKGKRGLLVKNWAPQMQILSHGSTSVFLSHCRWNSTLESLSCGVPIIGRPLSAEIILLLLILLQNRLIKRRLLSAARSVIEQIIQCSSLPDAVSVLDFAASRGLFSDPKRYSSLLHTLVRSEQLHKVERIYTACRGIDLEPSVLNCMIIFYSRLGKFDLAMTHLIEIVKMGSLPSRPAYDTMVRVLCIEERFLEAVEMFFQMVDSGILPGLSSLNLFVDRLASNGYLEEAVGVFRVMVESGIPPTIHFFKSLVYNFCKSRRVEEAECLCSEMESHGFSPDRGMYTSLIYGYCREGKIDLALDIFQRMQETDCTPD